jgi:TPR repeat protein
MKKWIGLVGILLLFLVALSVMTGFRVLHHRRDQGRSVRPPINVASIRSKADTGDAQAQWELGEIYARGDGVTRSYKEAAIWYRRAAEQGSAEARAALGELYQAGQGVSKDLAEASKWFQLAASQGNVRGQYSLGFMYETGRGLAQDQVQAAKWYRLAAEQGEPVAQYDLGQRYDLGVGVPVDRVEALKWLTLAAAQGQSDAAETREKVKSKMTRKEISEAKSRVASFSIHRNSAPPH